MASPVVFLQWATPDIPKMQAFYGELFGWDFTTRESGEFQINPHGPGDFDVRSAFLQAKTPQPLVTPWVRVVDLLATFEKAKDLGAEVIFPIREDFSGRHFCLIRALDGQTLAIVQA